MTRLLGLLLALTAFSPRSRGEEPPDPLAKAKAATVLVKWSNGRSGYPATGVVLSSANGEARILTFRCKYAERRTPSPLANGGGSAEVTLDAAGTHPARVVGADPETGLCVLMVNGLKRPVPIMPVADDLPEAGDPVVMLQSRPAADQTKAAIGFKEIELELGQLPREGAAVRGLSLTDPKTRRDHSQSDDGCPVLDAKGNLVALAGLRPDSAKSDVWAATDFRTALRFRPVSAEMSMRTVHEGKVTVLVRAEFFDPLGGGATPELLYADERTSGDGPPAANSRSFPKMKNAYSTPFKMDGNVGLAEFEVPLPEKESAFRFQVAYSPVKGETWFSPPFLRYVARPTLAVYPAGAAPPGTLFGGLIPPGYQSKSPATAPVVVKPPFDPRPAMPKDDFPARPFDPKSPDAAKPPGAVAGADYAAVADPKPVKHQIGLGTAAAMCWSADGKALYHLDGAGVVRRFAYPSMKEEAKVEGADPRGWLTCSKLGPVLTVPSAGEIRLPRPRDAQD